MSELETIGQRMGERLLASELLSSVEIELQEQAKSLILVLSPQTRELSPQYERIMRFCLNFQGNYKSLAQKKNAFVWCGAFVENISPNKTCRVWINCTSPCGYIGFDVLSELILLGLKLSQSLPPISHTYHMEHLMHIYRKKEDVLTFYERFIAYVIQANDDLPTEDCEVSLHTLWLCCPKHRFLFVQRLLLNSWLHHIFWNFDLNEEYLPAERVYLLTPPMTEELKRLLSDHLRQAFTPQQWLQARFAHSILLEEQHWERPTKDCQRKHDGWACCPLHTALSALSYLFGRWLEHFDSLYHMSRMVDEQGQISGLSSVNGMALFIHLAQLDINGLTFPYWFKDVPSVDIKQFHSCEDRARRDIF